MWPFRKKPEPKVPLKDIRVWNDDWKVGDTAECIVDRDGWADTWKPWHILEKGTRLTVTGFSEEKCTGNYVAYALHFAETKVLYPTQGFRKVRPVATEESEVVKFILNAKPGADQKRERVQ